MELRKIGDPVKLPFDRVIRSYGTKVLKNEAKAARAMPRTPEARKKLSDKEFEKLITAAEAKAMSDLEVKIKKHAGMTLVATYMGWQEAERWRLEAERNDLLNAKDIRDLKKENTAEEWPELHADKVVAPEAHKRLQDYMRGVLSSIGTSIDGAKGHAPAKGEELAYAVLGMGLGNVMVPAVLDAQRPSAEQIF